MIDIKKPFRISPSSLSVFNKCSMQFKWGAIDDVEPDGGTDNLFAVLGSTFHKCMELNDRYDYSLTDLEAGWRILFFNYMSELKNYDNKSDIDFFLKRGFNLLKKGIELKKRWQQNSTVVFNEKYFRIPFENKFINKVYISGRIDLAIKNKDDDIYTILDWKTGKNKDKNIDENEQMSFYIFYMNKMLNIPYENIFAALVYPFLDEVVFTQRNECDINNMFEKLHIMLEKISKGLFKKEPLISGILEDCTFCPFTKYCKKNEA